MIYANNKNALRYRGIHPGLDLALEHLTPEFLSGVGKERVELDGGRVYCFRVTFDSIPEEKAFFENHREYIDIHVVLDGAEGMEIALPENLKLYEERPETDAYFYHGTGYHRLTLTPGNFLVAFPEDAHKTQMMLDVPRPVTKVVFKIHI